MEEWRRHGMESIAIGIRRAKIRHGIPVDGEKKKKHTPTQSTEKATQQACMEYLDARGIFYYRQNTGATRTESGGFIRYGAVGSPDIIAVLAGQYIGIEVKDKHGKQSPGQVLFQQKLEKAGGRYLLIRDIDELIEAIT